MKQQTAINPRRGENYPEWYQEVIKAADMAENSLVRGCMVIKPWGYAIWEKMVADLDRRFKEQKVENAYFPLFIPLSLLQKEATHVEGFATECAVVTHHRLEKNKEGKLVPSGELEEPLIVRPTSEMIIGETFAKWIKSYRDLPLKINQWANVVRWEMRPRIFLRTAEFLWQEGHTAHETAEEALEMARTMLHAYRDFAKDMLAIPFYIGEKSEGERFPGAHTTFCIEGMMQDGKALQGGTSHFMHQNFAKASQIQFTGRDGQLEYAYTTSWGATTRLIGAVIMTHSDDNGLVLPPPVAPKQVVIIPFIMKEGQEVLSYCDDLAKKLEARGLRVLVDDSDKRSGEKTWHWIKKGVPARIEIGAKEIAEGRLALSLRHKEKGDVLKLTPEELVDRLPALLQEMHQALYDKALAFRTANTKTVHHLDDFATLAKHETFPHPFIRAPWKGDLATEERLKKDYNLTIRCILPEGETGTCLFSGKTGAPYALFAKAY